MRVMTIAHEDSEEAWSALRAAYVYYNQNKRLKIFPLHKTHQILFLRPLDII